MAYSSDAAYNARSRTIESKVDIYLNGPLADPVSITRDDYLITNDLLEEATSGDTLFDGVSSNEFTVQLHSPAGIFNPTNPNSPYYGKMRRGVKVAPFLRASKEDDWAPMGEFYVTQWTASTISQTANITADDVFYGIFGNAQPDERPTLQMSLAAFWKRIFDRFNIVPKVDSTLANVIPVAYSVDDNKTLFSGLCSAYLSTCNVDHHGDVSIRNVHAQQPIRATLTDSEQVLDVDAHISLGSAYDTAQLVYYVPVKGTEKVLVDESPVLLTPGDNKVVYNWSEYPLYRLKSVSVFNTYADIDVRKVECTGQTGKIILHNPINADVEARVVACGQVIEATPTTLGQEGENTLRVENRFVQTPAHAESLFNVLQRFTLNKVPVLTVQARGNPNLEIGDKIRVLSSRYDVDFTGILIRQHFVYNGGLSCTLTLLNADLVEVNL